jgi:hypothetical protein
MLDYMVRFAWDLTPRRFTISERWAEPMPLAMPPRGEDHSWTAVPTYGRGYVPIRRHVACLVLCELLNL